MDDEKEIKTDLPVKEEKPPVLKCSWLKFTDGEEIIALVEDRGENTGWLVVHHPYQFRVHNGQATLLPYSVITEGSSLSFRVKDIKTTDIPLQEVRVLYLENIKLRELNMQRNKEQCSISINGFEEYMKTKKTHELVWGPETRQ